MNGEMNLGLLIDFQKFEGNQELQQVIDSVHARYAVRELSFDELGMVSAAGTPDLPDDKKNGEK